MRSLWFLGVKFGRETLALFTPEYLECRSEIHFHCYILGSLISYHTDADQRASFL